MVLIDINMSLCYELYNFVYSPGTTRPWQEVVHGALGCGWMGDFYQGT